MSIQSVTAHRWWPWARRIGVAGFLAFVVFMLVHEARAIDWREVFATMRDYPLRVVALAALLAWTSHLIYSTFDLVGRRYTAHPLRPGSVMAITFVSYAFNLNLGTVVGALAMRVRLYTRLGLEAPVIARVVGLSMLTNWLGYCLLAGLAFLFWPVPMPSDWHMGTVALRVLGGVLVLASLAYMVLCAVSKRREFHVLGHEIDLPVLRLACVQLAISCANWSVMGATMYVLLLGQVAYPVALGVLLIGAISGLMSRVPAGLGVLEAVFIALLSPPLSSTTLIAAVLTYRAVYYWAPLAAATVVYLAMEAHAKKLAARASADGSTSGRQLQPSC
ncbi:YbhN family protein [Variovorax sp. dw_308]|uniref:lysylphosphatidylglycerol synthase transmembrane domain-containing protein n=1 Tax=Variovorax sp. dw_308 TaxID=2721546 RepID=UPI001C47F55D|nr:YbhN family protein [Variovorax sp. dw_308]